MCYHLSRAVKGVDLVVESKRLLDKRRDKDALLKGCGGALGQVMMSRTFRVLIEELALVSNSQTCAFAVDAVRNPHRCESADFSSPQCFRKLSTFYSQICSKRAISHRK